MHTYSFKIQVENGAMKTKTIVPRDYHTYLRYGYVLGTIKGVSYAFDAIHKAIHT